MGSSAAASVGVVEPSDNDAFDRNESELEPETSLGWGTRKPNGKRYKLAFSRRPLTTAANTAFTMAHLDGYGYGHCNHYLVINYPVKFNMAPDTMVHCCHCVGLLMQWRLTVSQERT